MKCTLESIERCGCCVCVKFCEFFGNRRPGGDFRAIAARAAKSNLDQTKTTQ